MLSERRSSAEGKQWQVGTQEPPEREPFMVRLHIFNSTHSSQLNDTFMYWLSQLLDSISCETWFGWQCGFVAGGFMCYVPWQCWRLDSWTLQSAVLLISVISRFRDLSWWVNVLHKHMTQSECCADWHIDWHFSKLSAEWVAFANSMFTNSMSLFTYFKLCFTPKQRTKKSVLQISF